MIITRSTKAAVNKQAVKASAVEASAVEASAVEAPAVEASAVEAPAVEAPAVEAPAVEAPAAEALAKSVITDNGEGVLNMTAVVMLADGAVDSATNGRNARTTGKKLELWLEGLRNRARACLYVKAGMEQAIADGRATKSKTAEGKDYDTTGNIKAQLCGYVNRAYVNHPDKVTLTTDGKGANRTVSLKFVALKDEGEKMQARIDKLLSDLNATETEATSLSTHLMGLYTNEQSRLANAQEEAAKAAESAKIRAFEAQTIRAKAMIAATGKDATPENIELAIAFLSL
jgi:hypothetical protein